MLQYPKKGPGYEIYAPLEEDLLDLLRTLSDTLASIYY